MERRLRTSVQCHKVKSQVSSGFFVSNKNSTCFQRWKISTSVQRLSDVWCQPGCSKTKTWSSDSLLLYRRLLPTSILTKTQLQAGQCRWSPQTQHLYTHTRYYHIKIQFSPPTDTKHFYLVMSKNNYTFIFTCCCLLTLHEKNPEKSVILLDIIGRLTLKLWLIWMKLWVTSGRFSMAMEV